MNYFNDEEFRERILALLTRDRKFLRKMSGKLSLQDFKAIKKDDADEWAREWVAGETLKYWREYRQPIGGLLRTFALDHIRENRTKIGKTYRESLLSLIERLKEPELGVAVEAIEQKIVRYKERQILRTAVEEMVEKQEQGKLQIDEFRGIVSGVMNRISLEDKTVNYGETLDRRIDRRDKQRKDRYPLLYIESFDTAMRTFPRGQVGLVLAPYKRGKSVFMGHLAQAHALQGLGTALFTLEDPQALVEDRLDASLCGLTLAELGQQDKRLRRRFREVWEQMRANIFLIDATGGGWSIQRMVEVVDNLRQKGQVVDVILIDYDEQIETVGKYTGESAIRMKSQEVWLDMVRWAARDDSWLWCAAQAKRKKEDSFLIVAEDTAEDISKIRKAALGIGIGGGPPGPVLDTFKQNSRFLQVMVHRFGRSREGWPIVGDFECGIFYDREATRQAQKLYDEQLARRKANGARSDNSN